MNKADCFYIGYIGRRVGSKGELGFVLDVDDASKYQNLESVFVEINNSLVPFFIKRIKIYNNNATVAVDGVESIERAEELIKSHLYLPLTSLPKLTGKKFYFHEMPGFKVIDVNYGELGKIIGILDYPNQAIIQVMQGDTEILIPAREEFIDSINRETKELRVITPDGLLDIYLKKGEDSEEEKEAE